jgi:hypothetical protein
VEAPGIENSSAILESTHSPSIAGLASPRSQDGSGRTPESDTFGPGDGPALDTETALARALDLAAAAGRFDVVAALADELKARRLAAAGNVVPIDEARRRGRS